MKEHWSGFSLFIQYYNLEKKRKTSRGGGTCFVRLLPQQDCNWRQWFLFSLILFFFVFSRSTTASNIFVCLLTFFFYQKAPTSGSSLPFSLRVPFADVNRQPTASAFARPKQKGKKKSDETVRKNVMESNKKTKSYSMWNTRTTKKPRSPWYGRHFLWTLEEEEKRSACFWKNRN